MHAMKLAAPGGIDQLSLADIEPRAPGFGEIQVEIKATSLNFHDYAVVTGLIPADDGRIPMSDGAGVVTAVGDGVTAYSVGDYSDSHSLKTLIKEFVNIDISKQFQSSDFGGELTPAQLKYCANDVVYLHKIHDELQLFYSNKSNSIIFCFFSCFK